MDLYSFMEHSISPPCLNILLPTTKNSKDNLKDLVNSPSYVNPPLIPPLTWVQVERGTSRRCKLKAEARRQKQEARRQRAEGFFGLNEQKNLKF